MPQAVVLPEPCRPAIRITVGGRFENESLVPAWPIRAVSSSWTILTTCWPGVRLSSTSLPIARSLTLGDEVLDDAEVDVGLEQRQADLAHGLVDVVLGQPPAALEAVEGRAEPIGE